MKDLIQYIITTPTAEHSCETLSQAVAGEVRGYHRGIPAYRETPLASLPALAERLEVASIHVKDESHRFGLNAFKALGGSYAMARILADELGVTSLRYDDLMDALASQDKSFTFVTATDGNHGRGVAWAAAQLGQRSVVYMPKNSSEERLRNIRKEGAKADILDCNYDDAVRYADEMAKKNGWILIQDTAWPGYTDIPMWILQGYLTMSAEVREQLGGITPTHIFLQAGVGSMAASVAGYFTCIDPKNAPKIVLVEPQQADCLYRTASAADGSLHIVTGDMDTIMAGLACGEPNPDAWEILRNTASAFLSTDDEIARLGMQLLAHPLGNDPIVVSGESGAPGLGAFAYIATRPEMEALKSRLGIDENSHALFFSTEGNTDTQSYASITQSEPQLA